MIPPERIARVQEILHNIHHAAIATVNDDGSPHNTPVFMAFDHTLTGYWSSHPDSVHSRNIAHTNQAFIVLFDSRQGHGGLFIEATAAIIEDTHQLQLAYNTLKSLKERTNRTLGPIAQYNGNGQRLYMARPMHLWLNMSEKDNRGNIVRDYRYKITQSDLVT
jgi:general stress protein 26